MEQTKKHKGKIIVFIGLPGCGKSTEAKHRMEDGNVMRVNRDDIRSMLFSRWKGKKEQVVTQVEKAAIIAAVSEGYDVIIDDTNLNPGTRARWKNLSVELGVSLVEESFETPIDTCVVRDSLRTGRAHVGRVVIENMALAYNLLLKLESTDKVVIFDIDGTLADCSHRRHYIYPEDGGKKDHKAFYAKVNEDTPIWGVIKWAQNCHAAGYVVLVVSGRPTDLAGDATVKWLTQYDVPYRHIFMRAGGDYRDDRIIKQEILDKILKWISKDQIFFCVDDRPRVIRMWRENSLRVFDVGPGTEF